MHWDDETLIRENIERWLGRAQQRNQLDLLGEKLGLLSDAEQARLASRRAERRSRIAIWIAVGSALVALGSLLVSLYKE